MDAPAGAAEIAVRDSPALDAVSSPEEAAFHFDAHWATADTSSLRPNRLPLAKPQRAWERRPRIPSRTIARLGTVWKRPASMAPSTFVPPHIRANFLRRESSSPRVAAKKIRLDNDTCVGASVSQWDVHGSPTRKIVTRSGAVDGEVLLALSDEEEEESLDVGDGMVEEGGDVTIEILNEDGTVVEANEHSLVEEARDWEDVEDEVPFDDTLMHLTDAVSHEQSLATASSSVQPSSCDSPAPHTSGPELDETAPNATAPEPAELRAATSDTPPAAMIVPPPVILPAGFVSPVKERRRLGAAERRKSTGRRQTLPVQFAPVPAVPEASTKFALPAGNAETADVVNAEMAEESAESVATLPAGLGLSPPQEVPEAPIDDSGNDEWEDVNDEEMGGEDEEGASSLADDAEEPSQSFVEAAVAAQLDAEMTSPALTDLQDDVAEAIDEANNIVDDASTKPQMPALRDIISDRALTSSPIPTLTSPHPRLPLRRSPRREPRRQSTSPVKKTSALADKDRSHLIAFTPVRRQPSPLAAQVISTPEQPATAADVPPSILLERSTSAPPAEPGMSPIKTARPRISDDTALLQAFLNRAAESKTSRLSITPADLQSAISTSPVKKVQSSPASQPPDVLGELDPNSPSPRKSTNFVPESPLTRRSSGPVDIIMDQEEETINFDLDEPAPRTRSGRVRRRPQPLHSAAQSGPNKISIRGQASAVDIRRSEAQELATQTRNNTKRNKGQAMLPVLRLKKLAAEDGADATTVEDEAARPTKPETARSKRRLSVTWSETLVAYSGDLVEPDTSVLTVDSTTIDDTLADEAPAVPLAVDTPSKPKMRKLRTTRTAASATAPPEPSSSKSSESSLKPKRTQRRPRAATPAKGLTNASLLPADLETDPQPASEPTPAVEKKIPVASKRPTSRIPAPASALGQGKENLNASPPKKKVALAVPSAKTFAPTLEFTKPGPKATDETVPGLMSPAKKGGRRPVTFSQNLETKRPSNDDTVPGLASPAKKRTRRMAA